MEFAKFKILKGQQIQGWRAWGFVFFKLIVGVFSSPSHFMVGVSFRKVEVENPDILY
jgi:hypothetical protein